MARDKRKSLKKRENEKRRYKKSLTMKQRQQTSLLLFFLWKRIYFVRKHSLGKTLLVKFF